MCIFESNSKQEVKGAKFSYVPGYCNFKSWCKLTVRLVRYLLKISYRLVFTVFSMTYNCSNTQNAFNEILLQIFFKDCTFLLVLSRSLYQNTN